MDRILIVALQLEQTPDNKRLSVLENSQFSIFLTTLLCDVIFNDVTNTVN